MSGLSDMEDLLSRVQNKAMVDYMREAISCYHSGAYRGCIVLSYIALFDDLREKLQELAKTNATARKIAKDIKQRQDDQQIFETYMVDQLRSAKLISEPESSMLEQVRVCRNKAAHPSGVHASPEEARFVFFEVVDKFLSKKLLLTTQAVDALMIRLANGNFFPSMSIHDTEAIVESELADLHEGAFPYLTEKLVEGCVSGDDTTVKNARRFLIGLAYLKHDIFTTQLRKRLVKARADDTNFAGVIVPVASANPAILDKHDNTTAIRIRSLLASAVSDTKSSVPITKLRHPVYLLCSMLDFLGEEKVMELYEEIAIKIVEEYRYTPSLAKKLVNAPTLKKGWIEKIKEEAGSSDFGVANRFATYLPDIDDKINELIKPKDAFEIVVAVCIAADIGAYTSQDLRSEKFSAVPNLRDMAISYAEEKPSAAGKILASCLVKEDDLGEFLSLYLIEEE